MRPYIQPPPVLSPTRRRIFREVPFPHASRSPGLAAEGLGVADAVLSLGQQNLAVHGSRDLLNLGLGGGSAGDGGHLVASLGGAAALPRRGGGGAELSGEGGTESRHDG